MARGLPFSKDARSYHPRAHHLRRLLHQQLDALLRAPVRRPHYGRGYAPHATPFGYYSRGGRRHVGSTAARRFARAESSGSSSAIGTLQVPPPMVVHRQPQEGQHMVSAFCPHHGWSFYPCSGAGSSAPRREATLEYTPWTPPYTPTPAVERYSVNPLGTMAARSGLPPYYNIVESSLAAVDVVYCDISEF